MAGVRVLDLGTMISGPFSARLLARLGAEVIRIEPPGLGDRARRTPGGSLHQYVNEGKLGVTASLDCASGRDLVLRLAAESQVVIENLGPSELADRGLGYDALSAENPQLVLTSITAFGDSGPYRNFRSSELTLFAMGGHMYRSGVLGRPPLRMGGSPAQFFMALNAAFATLLAVRAAEQHDVGQQVTCSIFENQVTAHAQAMVEISYYGEETGAGQPRGGGQLRGLKTIDGMAMVSAQEQQMPSLVEMLGAPAELGRPDPQRSAETRGELMKYTSQWAAERTKREVYEQGQAAHIPASYVANPADLIESPQYQSRGFIETIELADGTSASIPGMPFSWPDAVTPARRAPELGEHNATVYPDLLGLTQPELTQLAGAGAI